MGGRLTGRSVGSARTDGGCDLFTGLTRSDYRVAWSCFAVRLQGCRRQGGSVDLHSAVRFARKGPHQQCCVVTRGMKNVGAPRYCDRRVKGRRKWDMRFDRKTSNRRRSWCRLALSFSGVLQLKFLRRPGSASLPAVTFEKYVS